jgi:hypothetical protein
MPRFEVVEETDENPKAPSDPIPSQTLDTILLGLKALPKRIAFALSNCFALLTVATVFWLALLIIPYEPNSFQLAGLAGYAVFVIAINVITRRS